MHLPPQDCLPAHSVAEAFLYVSLTYCPRCQRRSVRAQGRLECTDPAAAAWNLSVACQACGETSTLTFRVSPAPNTENLSRVNPLLAHSDIIDLNGWLALFNTILDGAGRETDRAAGRELALEAAQCLDEALKFYDPDSDLPPASAFFTPASLQRFRDHPQAYVKSRLLQLKSQLPSDATARRAAPAQKPWWKRW